MCFGGGAPQAPSVQYVGPSQGDIDRQEKSLETFQQQMQQQQADTAAQIQKQIDDANARTAEIQAEYDREIGAADTAAQEAADAALLAKQEAAAAAGASYTPVGAYGVTASKTDAPNAKTTEKIKAKKKPKNSLKIGPSAASSAGAGINLGI